MDSDEETEIFSYTPLKRQKIGGNESLRSSQISYSQVQKRGFISKINSQSDVGGKSRKRSLSQNKQNLSLDSHKTETSTLTFKHPGNTYLTSKGTHKSKETTNIVNLSSDKLPGNSQNRNNESTFKNRKTYTKPFHYCSSEDSDLTESTNIFEEDMPDLDFTLVNDKDILVRAKSCDSEEKLFSLSSDSSTGNVSMSLLEDRPSGFTKKTSSNVFHNKSVKEHTNQKKKKIQNISTPYKSTNKNVKKKFVFCDDEDFVEPVEEQIQKVNSWLNSSLEYLTAQKVEITLNPSPDEETPSCSNKAHREQSPIASPIGKATGPKACIHLHFHVASPQKLVQPTIDKYFKKTSVQTTEECENKSKSKGSNGAEVMKVWKDIMNSMRGCSPNTEVQTSISQKTENPTSGSGTSGAGANISNFKNVNLSRRKCPFYKFVEDTNFVVDAFSYGYINGVSAYFLSHFHYDHYRGLHKSFNKIIYCSKITANLVRLKIHVENRYLRPLPLEEPRIINGVEVSLYDANHCPGAVMFLFKLPTGKTLLHVGDFRAHPIMENISAFWNLSLDVLYLDTTYLDPLYDFPSQEEALEKCVGVAKEHLKNSRKTLFLVGSYTVGKEKVFRTLATELDCRIYAPDAKRKVLLSLEDREIAERLTKNKFDAQVHVVAMSELTPIKLKKYMGTMQSAFKSLVAIKPTGWEYCESISESLENLQPKQIGNIYIYGIPYSEHSSYYELQRFAQFVQAKKIIPTVNNGSGPSRERMKNILKKWQIEARSLW